MKEPNEHLNFTQEPGRVCRLYGIAPFLFVEVNWVCRTN